MDESWSLALLCSLLAIGAEAGQPTFRGDPDYLIDTWETEDGCPDGPLYAMAQTPDGYLWLGTRDGMVRFDGMKFRVFGKASIPELPHPAVMKLEFDRSQRLWAGTVGGLAVRNGAKWRTVALPGTNNNRGNHLIFSLAGRSGGDLLVTTYDGGVLEFHDGRFQTLPPPPGETNSGYVGCSDGAGNWWVAQHRFVGKWNGQRWVETVSLAAMTNLGPGQVGCLAGREGGVWLVLGTELRHFRGEMETLRVPLPGMKGKVSSVLEDSRGKVWICTRGAGLWQVNSNSQVRHWSLSNGLPDSIENFAFEDREQNVWVGTEREGLTRFKARTFHSLITITNKLTFARFALAASPTSGVFIASLRNGLWRADAAGRAKMPLPKPFGDDSVSALSLLVDRTGCFWIGAMPNGVWRVEGQDARLISIEASERTPVDRLFEDSRGRIWMAGGPSAAVFDAGQTRNIATEQGLPSGSVRAFAEDKTGAVWLTHERGVFRQETNRWVEVLDAGGGSLRMENLLADSDGAMWMASINNGLACWREGRLWRKRLPPELPMRGAYMLREDSQGFFWMTSNKGILRARKSELRSWLEGRQPVVAWRVFDVSDGLPGEDCGLSARDEHGRLWFATSRGVAWMDPAVDRPDSMPPPVQIEELTYHRAAPRTYGGAAAGSPPPPEQSRLQWPFLANLTLPPGSRRLEVHFTAFDFAAPGKLRFQTRLEPSDSDWHDAGERRIADYYDFNPGSYVFRVRAVNHAGVWSETRASFAFTVLPFYWQTFWFRGAMGFLLAAAGGGVVLWRNRARRRLELADMERVRRESAERGKADERFRLAVESSPNGILLVNGEGRMVLANAHVEELFGYGQVELIGQTIEMLLPERFRGAHSGHRAGFFASPQARTMGAGRELFARRKDGTEFPVEVGLSPIHTEEGTLVLTAIVDITARRQAEADAVQQRVEVAHVGRVAVMGEMASSLAHELSQPLGAILRNAEAAELFLQHPSPDMEEVRAILADIRKDDQRAGAVIDRMRAMLKRREVEQSLIDLNALVGEVISLVRFDADSRKVRMAFEPAAALPSVSGDRVQLQQVLLNLLLNAMDAMKDQTPDRRCVTVRLQVVGAQVGVSVTDAGHGIPADKLPRVFEAFFTTKPKGLGMGLAISRRIIEAHGGRLWAENNAAGGATFTFSLPPSGGEEK